MRSLDDARDSWQELKKHRDIHSLKSAAPIPPATHSAPYTTSGIRSASWKAFLLFEDVNTSQWPRTLLSSRSAYNSLRMHFLRQIEDGDEQADPLSEETDSTWKTRKANQALRAEIQQDVDRCMPENMYFRQPDAKRMLLDILYVYSKLNADISYRQGMHELLAPILWVVERDAINLGRSSKAMGEDALIKAVFDAEHIEHDAFALFAQVMQSAKNFYEQTTHSGSENPMVARSRRIVFELLPLLDKELAQHLEKLDIVPQVFLMRWIRLLFGREVPFDDMLTMWDVLFAEDTSLELVDHICLTMLLRIRWELMEGDYNSVLTSLLRYPAPDKDFPPQTFVTDALYLRDHMHATGGSVLVLKYSGRPLQPTGRRPVTPPALQRNITAFSGVNAARAALNRTQGISKAVRSAVDEVHRKAQELRDAPTPSPPPRKRWPAPDIPAKRVKELEHKNVQLSKLLEGAVAELWEYQRRAAKEAEDGSNAQHKEAIDQLSIAIAKVQFVQVSLSDFNVAVPSLPEAAAAALDTTPEQIGASPAVDALRKHMPPLVSLGRDSEAVSGSEAVTSMSPTAPVPPASPSAYSLKGLLDDDAESTTLSHRPPAARPALAGSSYSFMLGQETARKSPPGFFDDQRQNRGYLFGNAGDDSTGVEHKSSAAKGRTHRKTASSAAKVEDGEDVFDLGSLKNAKRT
ncbi:hypothetical protein B0A48_11619 [Cryoendolithus antarcticus]|uniref:Rab-GAP TBC domain-containing protein n=1 Tax=Cryoendolithus antarcticus TaxID=1507870 RepID=A0A1V8SWD8_9PEZI|nr:hypothetical protein B0A48_11619 [Cryoendolithus antarcticus]